LLEESGNELDIFEVAMWNVGAGKMHISKEDANFVFQTGGEKKL
jgi:hypothetical protein